MFEDDTPPLPHLTVTYREKQNWSDSQLTDFQDFQAFQLKNLTKWVTAILSGLASVLN